MSSILSELLRGLLSLSPEPPAVAILPGDVDLAVELAPVALAVTCIRTTPSGTSEEVTAAPAGVANVDAEVSSLPLRDGAVEVLITPQQFAGLPDDRLAAALTELDRVVALGGLWIVPSLEAASTPERTFRAIGLSEASPSTLHMLEAAFPCTYVASHEQLRAALDATGEAAAAAPVPSSSAGSAAQARADAASSGQLLLVRCRHRIAWLDGLVGQVGPGSWIESTRVQLGASSEGDRDALVAEIDLLRAELERPMYRLVRRIRRAAERAPWALGVLQWGWRTLSTVRHRAPRDVAAHLEESPGPRDGDYPLRARWMVGAPPQQGHSGPSQLHLVMGHPRDADDPPLVSIVVLSFNNGALTQDCLRNIWSHTEGVHYEVIVVENGSHPSEALPLQPYRGQFRYVPLAVNRYFGEGNNIGAEAARGDVLVFLNNDAMVCDGWLPPLVAAVGGTEIGAAGARLMFADGRVQETGALLRPDGSAVQLEKSLALDEVPADGNAVVDYCSAACLALRADLFRRVGGFDLCWEPAYYEDTDLCFKIRAQGLSVVCVRESRVVHLEHATTSRRFKGLDLRGQPEFNQRKFMDRWGAVLRGEVPITDYASRVLLERPSR